MACDVALLITCLTDPFYPHVGVAVTKILEHYGCTVHFPSGQTCCGQPFFNNGYHEQAKELAKHLIEVFEPYEYVVTPSASCCIMVREQYPRLLRGDIGWDRGMRKVCQHTYEFVEFLDKVLKIDFSALKLPRREKVTYHYGCHTRAIRSKDESERMLGEIRNLDYQPMERVEQCCGFGGTFAGKYPAISGAIAEDKVRSIAATRASTVVCDDAGCAMNISGMCHRHGVDTRVKHIAELIAEALGLDVTGW